MLIFTVIILKCSQLYSSCLRIPKYLKFLWLCEGQDYYLGYKYGLRTLIKLLCRMQIFCCSTWKHLENDLLHLQNTHLITFWLRRSKTEFDKSRPLLWDSDDVEFKGCSLAGRSETSEPLDEEKSIGELFLSSSNIPNDTKTDWNWNCLLFT